MSSKNPTIQELYVGLTGKNKNELHMALGIILNLRPYLNDKERALVAFMLEKAMLHG